MLARIQSDESLPGLARELFAAHAQEYAQLQAQIDEVEGKLIARHKTNPGSRRLAQIPGIGPIGAAMLIMKTPAPETFRSGRQFAAWIGLTPKDHSTAGKVRPGVITRAGDEGLRSALVVGATAVIGHPRNGKGRSMLSAWVEQLLKRKPPKLAAVALANKLARIAWKLIVTAETYAAKPRPVASGRAPGIGVQSAIVLVREAFVREFANGKALGSYAGLTPTPFSSGATEREQGIGKAGNRRLRTVMVELAWLWQRYQPGSAEAGWFRQRVGGTGRRMRKVMVVAMARRLLIALWRFATQGVVPEGAIMKPA